MPGARIEEGATVQYAIVAEDSVVGANSVVGQRPEDVENKEDWGVAVIGPGCKLAPGTVVPPKAMIDAERWRSNARQRRYRHFVCLMYMKSGCVN